MERVLPTIDMALCTGCGLCVDQCPTRAVEMGARAVELGDARSMNDILRPVIVRPGDCVYCGLCEEMCPEGAIALSYEIVLSDKRGDHEATNRSH
jgi:4Fe-4S ferredoxin